MRRQRHPLAGDVLPDVQLGPVRQREDPDALAGVDPPVVQRPQLGALVLRVPLAELVAEGEHPLLRPRLVLVAAGAAERRAEPVLGQGRPAAPGSGSGCGCRPAARATSPRCDAPRAREATSSWTPSSATRRVAEVEHLGEVVPGVDVHAPGTGCGPGQNAFSASRSITIESLPPENSSTGRSSSADHLADDVDRLRLQGLQLGQPVSRRSGCGVGPAATVIGADPLGRYAEVQRRMRPASSGRQTSRSGSHGSGRL